MNILVTGASGLIGKALSESLSKQHEVVGISRHNPELDLTWIQGDFSKFEDLQQLDQYDFDCVVHLAALLPKNAEHDFIHVNVEGARRLMRYSIDRDCKKFVIASSIGAAGIQNIQFRPAHLPIRDNHPCLDRDGYGLSKHLLEEITRYCHRQDGDIDVINLRLSTVRPDDDMPELLKVCPPRMWGLGATTMMTLSDSVRVFTAAVEAPHQAGVRTMNAANPKSWVADPIADILRNWWGDDVDLSYFEQAGNEFASVFDVNMIREELGFVAKDLPPQA